MKNPTEVGRIEEDLVRAELIRSGVNFTDLTSRNHGPDFILHLSSHGKVLDVPIEVKRRSGKYFDTRSMTKRNVVSRFEGWDAPIKALCGSYNPSFKSRILLRERNIRHISIRQVLSLAYAYLLLKLFARMRFIEQVLRRGLEYLSEGVMRTEGAKPVKSPYGGIGLWGFR